MDGTEALDGSTPAAAAPATGGTAQAMLQASNQDPGPAPAPADLSGMTAGQQPPDMGAPASPEVTKRGGLAGVLNAVLDFLAPPQRNTISRDENGNRVVTPQASLTTGQQIAKLGLTMAQGATTAMAAPPGPGHVGQGASAAFQQSMKQTTDAAQQQEEDADKDFAIRQKAKMDNANYQLLTREVTRAGLMNTEMQAKNTKDAVDFSNGLIDREKALGSYDLGVVKNAGQIADTISKLPDWEQSLYKHNALMPITEHAPDGTVTGIHLYLRKPDVGSQPAPDGTQAHKFVPPVKPGDKPQIVAYTPTDHPTNAQIANYDLKAQQDQQQWLESQHKDEHLQAQTQLLSAQRVEALASAAKSAADARKTRIEATAMQGDGQDTSPNEQNAEAMVDGRAAPSQFSKRAKDYNAMLPLANAYSLKKYGVPFDAEISEGRYNARKKTIDAFGAGKEGDQLQTFNQFLAHAGDLSHEIDQLRNTNVKLLNKPLKSLREAMGATQYARIDPLITAVRTEHANFLNNNHALHEQDINEGHDMLGDDMTLAQAQDAIKQFGATAIRRVGALNERYRRVVGAGDVPAILDPYSRQVIQGLGLTPVAQSSLNTAWSNPQGVQQNPSSPPSQQGQQQQQQQPKPAAGGFDWNAHPKAN